MIRHIFRGTSGTEVHVVLVLIETNDDEEYLPK